MSAINAQAKHSNPTPTLLRSAEYERLLIPHTHIRALHDDMLAFGCAYHVVLDAMRHCGRHYCVVKWHPDIQDRTFAGAYFRPPQCLFQLPIAIVAERSCRTICV